MTITALPSQVQPVTNKRNATLLQKGMEEALGVPSSRGIIRFVAVAEENLATNGKTVLGEIEELQKEAGEPVRLGRETSKSTKRKSMRSIKGSKRASTPLLRTVGESTPPASEDGNGKPPLPQIPTGELRTENDRRAENVKKMGRRRSFMAAVFGKV